MKFLSDILAKAGLTVDGVVTLNNTATGQTPDANDNSTKLATTAWVRTFVQPYSLPIASASTLGGIKVGAGLSINPTTGVLTASSGISTRDVCIFIATAGQTTFSCSYTVDQVDVFYNGSKLGSSEFTATNGTTVVFNTACKVNDYVEIVSWVAGAGLSTSRTITIDGVTQDLTANRIWNILPTGGAAGDILAKVSGTNYDVTWIPNYTSSVKHYVKLGESMTIGTPVYVSGGTGNAGTNMIVSKASNASESTSSKTFGLTASGGVTNDEVFVVTEGLVSGIDTSTASAGDPVWLGTNGQLIFGLLNKPYAPAHLVFIGIVTRAQQNNGEIFVKVQNGFELDELHDLSVKDASDGDMIKFVASTGLWTKIAATTTNITEGTNLYYTQARFDTAFAAKSTSNLTEGTNLYYTTARVNSDFDTRLATKSTTNLAEGTNLYYTDTRVGTYLTSNSYATQSYVSTQIANLVDSAPTTLDTLNELAAALGDDPNFATTVSTSIGTKVPQTRTITINGTAYDLSADRSWSIAAGVTSFNTRTGAITLTSGDVTGALGFTPYNATNPSGYISSYTETDTLASVTGRGNTTSSAVYFSGAVNVYNTDGNDFRLYHGGSASGSARVYYHQPTNQLRIYASDITSDATIGIGSLALYNGSAYKVVLTEATVGSYALLLSGGTITGTAVINGGAAHPLAISSGQRYQLQIRNTNNSTNSGYGWWWFMDTNFNMGFHADGASDRFTLTRDGNLSVSGTLSASGYNDSNWNTAYGWGNHASAGYITSSASITGNAANITGAQIMNTSAVAENDAFPGYNQTASYIVTSSTGGGDGYIQSWRWTGGGYVTQFYTDVDPTGIFALRQRDGAGTWGSWYRLLHSGNYTSYSPSLTGSGASGTWGINITGSANSASSATIATSAYRLYGYQRGSFTVGGDTSTFYPVAFQIGSGSTDYQGISVLQIERGGYDQPGYSSTGFGTFQCRIRAKADGWGYGASYVQVEANAYTIPMLADVAQQNQTSQLIVWLRGGQSYRWYDVEGAWGLNFDNSSGGNYTTFNNNVTYYPTTTNTIGGNFKYQQGWGNNYIGGQFTAGNGIVSNGQVVLGYASSAGAAYGNPLWIWASADSDAIVIQNTTSNGTPPKIYFRDTNGIIQTGNSVIRLRTGNNNATSAYIDGSTWNCTGDIIAYASDRRLKENIVKISNAIDKVNKLSGVTFDWNQQSEKVGFTPKRKLNEIGVIAQEVQAVIPQAIEYAPFDRRDDGTSISGENYLTVKYEKIVPLLIEAIKELKAENDALKDILKRNNII